MDCLGSSYMSQKDFDEAFLKEYRLTEYVCSKCELKTNSVSVIQWRDRFTGFLCNDCFKETTVLPWGEGDPL